MNILAFETSTAVGSVALLKDGSIFGTKTSREQKKHTEFITQAAQELLTRAQLEISEIDHLAVSIGPGSFTGIRVSVNTVRTYAQLLGQKIHINNSLQILASQTDKPSICLINAYKNMVYISAFDGNRCLLKPQAILVEQIEKYLLEANVNGPILFIGDGYSFYEKTLQNKVGKLILRDPNLSDFPKAENLAQIAFQNSIWTNDWKSIIPLYIRASEAEENLNKK